jgi:hypothetical protein
MDAGRRSTPRLALFLLALLTIAALIARLGGIGTRLPHQTEPDSVIVTQAAWFDRPAGMELGTAEAGASEFYPRLLSFVLAKLPGRSFARQLPVDAPLEAHLAAAAEPFLRGRILIAFLSVLLVPGTFLLARRFLDPWTALLAAAFAATSLVGQFYGSQARPHAASASLSLLAVLAILRLRRDGSLGAYALAAVASALAVACLWNGVFVGPALAVGFLFAARKRGSGVLLCAVALALAVALAYDFLFKTTGVAGSEVKLGGQRFHLDQLDGSGFWKIVKGFFSFDPVMLVAGCVGLVLFALRSRRKGPLSADALKDFAVAAAFPLSFALFWGATSRVPPRFSLPLLPYVAILAAYGSVVVLRRAWLAIPLLALPVYACAKLTVLHVRPDTMTLVARWIEAHADRERDVVAVPYLADLPLLRDRADLEAVPPAVQSPWQRYQRRLPSEGVSGVWKLPTVYDKAALADLKFDPAEVRAWLERNHPDYVVVTTGWSSGNAWDSTRDVLREDGAELVASFPGGKPGSEELADLGFEQGERALVKIFAMVRPGPWVEIYRRTKTSETK